MAASWTPCERSPTSSLLGQRVAAMRRRKSSIRSSGTSTWNGPIAAAVSTVVLNTTSVLERPRDPTLHAGHQEPADEPRWTRCRHRSTVGIRGVLRATGCNHGTPPASTSTVIGRDVELAALREFLSSDSDLPAALVLDGEAGIGKTTLWHAGVELAQASH